MDNNDELKEVEIKNSRYYYFDDPDNILIDKKSCENILVYNILYKRLIISKPLRISFNKRDGFNSF